MVLLLGPVVVYFSSFNVASAQVITERVTYDYYVVAGHEMEPTLPSPSPSPSGFQFSFDPPVANLGNLTLGDGGFVSNWTGVKVNVTNLLGYDIVITNLTAEVTAGTPTQEFWHRYAGKYYGNFTCVGFESLDPWDPVYPKDEVDYYTGEITYVRDGDAFYMAVGIPYPETMPPICRPDSLVQPDYKGDAAATGHVAPIPLAAGATFQEYFIVKIFGLVEAGTQINGTITLALTYEYTQPGSPAVSFTYTPTDPKVGEVITFDASASTPNGGNLTDPDSYVWNFGDGTNGTGMIVNHTYTAAGNYTVVLNVTDSEEQWNYASQSVIVTAAVASEFPWLWIVVGVVAVVVVLATVAVVVKRRRK